MIDKTNKYHIFDENNHRYQKVSVPEQYNVFFQHYLEILHLSYNKTT